MTETQAKQIDTILNMLIDKSYMTKIGYRLYPKHVFEITNIKPPEVIFLFEFISNNIVYNNDSIITVVKTNPIAISKNYNTERFLNDGGCINWYKQQFVLEEKRNELAALEKQKLLNDIEAFRVTKKQYIWTIGLAIAGVIISILSILFQIF